MKTSSATLLAAHLCPLPDDNDALVQGFSNLGLADTAAVRERQSRAEQRTQTRSAVTAPAPAQQPGSVAYRVLALDFESTGRCVARDRIIDIGVRDLSTGMEWGTAVDPGLHWMSKKITELTGITLQKTQQEGVPTPVALRQLIAFITNACSGATPAATPSSSAPQGPSAAAGSSGAAPSSSSAAAGGGAASSSAAAALPPTVAAATAVLLVHNGAVFDVPLLRNECFRHGIALPPGWLFLDSFHLAKQHNLGQLHSHEGLDNLKLGTLKTFFKVEEDGPAHTALADTRVLALVYPGLMRLCARTGVADLVTSGSSAVGPLESCRCHLGDRETVRSQVLQRCMLPSGGRPPVEAALLPGLLASDDGVSLSLHPAAGASSFWSLSWSAQPGAPLMVLLRDVQIAFLVSKEYAFRSTAGGNPWKPSWGVLLSSRAREVEQLGQALDGLVARRLVPAGGTPALKSCLKRMKSEPMLQVSLAAEVVHSEASSAWLLRTSVHDLATGAERMPALRPVPPADGGGQLPGGGVLCPTRAAQDAAVEAVNEVLAQPPSRAEGGGGGARGRGGRARGRGARGRGAVQPQRADADGGEGSDAGEGTEGGEDGAGAAGEGPAAAGPPGAARRLQGVCCDVVLSPSVLYRSDAGCGMKLVLHHVFRH